jgi:hypothetical protein
MKMREALWSAAGKLPLLILAVAAFIQIFVLGRKY